MSGNRLLAVLVVTALVTAGCGAARKSEAPKTQSPSYTSAPSRSQDYGPPASPSREAMPAQPAPGGMYYQDAGTNPAVATERQSVSTFGVDVDTASYTLVRGHLNRDMLPPPEAVRVEEFINYFPQRYPATSQPVALYVEGGPNPFRPGMHLVQVGLKARDVQRAERKPAVLTFVIDVSGSMNMENRLGLVKRTLYQLLDQLDSDDQVGVVVFGTTGRVLMQHTSDKNQIRRAIERLTPEGSTNAAQGLQIGYELADRAFLKGGTNRVILCSDGVANVGLTSADAILRTIEESKSRGITLTTVGFGMGNHNDALMEQLADKGDGQYAYVDTLDEARRVFVEQLTGTLQLMAKDVKIQVEFRPEEVLSYRLVGYENRVMSNQDFRNDARDAGEMGAGHTVTALYEVQLRGDGAELGRVSVRYKEPDSAEVVELSMPISRRAITGQASARLRWTASVAEFAGLLKETPWAVESSLRDVLEEARLAAADLDWPEQHRDAVGLMEKALSLRQGR
ncbi:MAG TPA: von Willebrand factor type A domain-containing protein [Symbiobacteriaceae bacterium]|nr:von Willebrand factor type A domain-containing protein [Symbiobacteriaceae bacterium]